MTDAGIPPWGGATRSSGRIGQPRRAGLLGNLAELDDSVSPGNVAERVPLVQRATDDHDVSQLDGLLGGAVHAGSSSHAWTRSERHAEAVLARVQLLCDRDAERPLHVACIMDGNGRWARRRSLPRTAGHTEGEENLAAVVRLAVKRDIGWLTVFGFSTENWVRPRVEVRHILGLHKKLFGRIAELNELNVRVQWIGRPFSSPEARTPRYVQKAIAKAIADTATNTGMVLTVAFDYGSRAEIVHAAEAVVTEGRAPRDCCRPRCAHVPARAAPGRRGRANFRRASHLQFHAVAVGRLTRLLHRADLARLRRSRTRRRDRRRPASR